jgi:hypothetical protein
VNGLPNQSPKNRVPAPLPAGFLENATRRAPVEKARGWLEDAT